MHQLLAALITALLNGSLSTIIEHNLSIIGTSIAGEVGNSIMGRKTT